MTTSVTVKDLLHRVRARRRLPPPAKQRLIRELAGLSQEDIAQALGCTRMAVSLWESGRRTPRPPLLARYVALLDRIGRSA
jgi:transcriptional regulator with XRE-family HTH domain